MLNLKTIFTSAVLGLVSSMAIAETTSHFKFPIELPDNWVVISPEHLASANAGETMESLGISNQVDSQTFEAILKKVKSGSVEFYFDKNYLGTSYQNNVSVQVDAPLKFSSVDELKQIATTECGKLDVSLESVFGEAPIIHACGLSSSNGMVIFSHTYTIKSQNVVIANTSIPMGDRFSFSVVAGATLDGKGEKSTGDMHKALINSITNHVVTNMKKPQ